MSTNFRGANAKESDLDGSGLRVAIVCGRFNDLITERLLAGAASGLSALGVSDSDVELAWVPGAFEIPLAARAYATSGRFDAVITLGAVIRGETAHFEYVAGGCAEGVQRVQRRGGVARSTAQSRAHRDPLVQPEARAARNAGGPEERRCRPPDQVLLGLAKPRADHLQLERHGIADSMGTEDLRNGDRDFLAGEQPTFHGR